MSQTPSSSPSSHITSETDSYEKEESGLDIDLNHPVQPQTVEVGEIHIKHDQTPERDLINVENDQGGGDHVHDHEHDIEGSSNNKATRGPEYVEASTSLNKRKRYTIEEKGKRKVDCDEAEGDDGWLELRLGPLPAVEDQ